MSTVDGEWLHIPSTDFSAYYSEQWLTVGFSHCVVRRKDGALFYVSPTETIGDDEDVGPFETLEAAQAACLLAGAGKE